MKDRTRRETLINTIRAEAAGWGFPKTTSVNVGQTSGRVTKAERVMDWRGSDAAPSAEQIKSRVLKHLADLQPRLKLAESRIRELLLGVNQP
jgi:hypothetical protein